MWLGLAAAAVLAVAVYANALDNGFVWDDPIILERQLVVFDSFAEVMVTPRGIPHYSPDYYRPTTTASYLLDQRLGGADPWWFHFSVVLAHAVVVFLVGLLTHQLLGPGRGAALAAVAAAALFAVHPVHTESVAWAAGRSDVLATLFVLATLLLLGRPQVRPTQVALSFLTAFAALGAKEVALALYPLLALRAVLDPRLSPRRADLMRYAGVAVALALYLYLRQRTIGEVVGQQPGEASIAATLPSFFWAAGAYVRELVWPLPLNAYIDAVPVGLVSFVAVIALLSLLAWAAVRWRAEDWIWAYAGLWIPIALAPSLAILWKIPEVPMAERYAYLPSVAACILAGAAAARLERWRNAYLGVVCLVVVGCALVVWQRNPVWHDDVRLWEDTRAKTTVSGMAWRSLGAAYLRQGRYDDAEVALNRALPLANPPLGLQGVFSNLGTIGMYRGDYAGAQVAYEKALELTPDAPDVLFNLGLSIFYGDSQSSRSAAQALPHLLRASQLSPHDPDIDVVLGQVYIALDRIEPARSHLQAALSKGLRGETRTGVDELLETLGRL